MEPIRFAAYRAKIDIIWPEGCQPKPAEVKQALLGAGGSFNSEFTNDGPVRTPF